MLECLFMNVDSFDEIFEFILLQDGLGNDSHTPQLTVKLVSEHQQQQQQKQSSSHQSDHHHHHHHHTTPKHTAPKL